MYVCVVVYVIELGLWWIVLCVGFVCVDGEFVCVD